MIVVQNSYFEDFDVAQEEMRTPARTVTEADVVAFAGLSGDHHALHTDVVSAAQGPYGDRVAHGLLGLSIASGLLVRLGVLGESILAFREVKAKFRRPVFIGDTVHARVKVLSTKRLPRTGGGLVELDVRLVNQDDQVTSSGEWKLLVRCRGA